MSPNRQTRRSEAEVSEILDRLRDSGLSVSAFARRESIPVSTIHQWRRKPRKGVTAPRLRRVNHTIAPLRVAEIVLVNGHRIRIPEGFSSPDVENLLRVVAACSA